MLGIITFQITNNFGAYLHTIALFRKVKELGCDCEVINYRCPSIINREKPSRPKGISLKGILAFIISGKWLMLKYNTLQNELSKYVDLSPNYTPSNLKESNTRYSAFMVGSDVVWSLRITQNDYNFFLEFADDGKLKYAFSSSVGECELYRDDSKLRKLLCRFDSIAVRDEDAVEWVENISGKNAIYVCDPTMLYNANEWDEIIHPKSYKSDYVLVYFASDKIICDAREYAAKHHLQVKVIHYGRPISGVEVEHPISLAEFVGLIKHAQMVCTASYHGMLFSLYYQKELLFYNHGLKTRMASLASILHIENYCGDTTNVSDYQPMKYEVVNKRMMEFKSASMDVLMNMIKSIKYQH